MRLAWGRFTFMSRTVTFSGTVPPRMVIGPFISQLEAHFRGVGTAAMSRYLIYLDVMFYDSANNYVLAESAT